MINHLIQYMNINSIFWFLTLIMAPLQKLVLAPGATIQDNTVLGTSCKNAMVHSNS